MEWWLQFIIIVLMLGGTIFLGMPVAFAIGFTALMTVVFWLNTAQLYLIALTAVGRLTSPIFVAIPLFVFMAELLVYTRIAEDAFTTAHKWLSKLPGGLAVSAEILATMVASILGTSTGGAAVVGGTAIPEMQKRGYDNRLACGSTAAGGALGILIPPSLFFLGYAIIAEVSVNELFIAGLVPGLLIAGLFIIYIIIRCARNPSLAPPPPSVTWGDRFSSLWRVLATLFLVIFMLVAIYQGICSINEVAGLAAFFAMFIALIYRRLNWPVLRDASMKALRITAMICWILIGAFFFSHVLNFLSLPQQLCQTIVDTGMPSWAVIVMINIILMVLGCMMDPGAILMFSVPIFLPVVEGLGYDPIWFGVMFVVNMEMAEITPPFGLNLFIIKSVVPDVPMGDIMRGAVPFIILQLIVLVLIIVFPQIALWLPGTM